MKIALDGSDFGFYRGDCECGFSYTGRTVPDNSLICSPAQPIAEAVVHYRMCHLETTLQLVFTDQFQRWLCHYWEGLDKVSGLVQATMARA
jgi:hypothetical protein